MQLKAKLRLVVEENSTRSGRIFDIIIQSLIVISLISFCIETLPDLSANTEKVLNLLEIIIVIIFSIEYILRLILTDKKLHFLFSFYGLIDLLAILPFYLATGIDLRSIRVFRIFRVFRAFKIVRYSKALQRFKEAFTLIKSELVIFFIAALFLIFVSSVCIYYFENPAQPEAFSSVFSAMWWAIATLTTVGYGDMYPITIGGKIFTSFITLIGLGIVAVPSGLIASAMSEVIKKER